MVHMTHIRIRTRGGLVSSTTSFNDDVGHKPTFKPLDPTGYILNPRSLVVHRRQQQHPKLQRLLPLFPWGLMSYIAITSSRFTTADADLDSTNTFIHAGNALVYTMLSSPQKSLTWTDQNHDRHG